MPLLKIVAAGVIVISAAAPPLGAQELPGGQSKSEVAPVVRPEFVRASVARESARLAQDRVREVSDQSQSPTERSWVGRHPVLTGALVGASAGAVWADDFCRGQCEGDPRPYMALFGGVGAGIGAGIGGVTSAILR